MHKHTIPLIDGAVSFRRRLGWRSSILTATGLPLCMHSLGLSRVTWPLRRPTPWAGKRPDRGLTLDLAAQSVVLPSNSPSRTTKEVAGVRAQPHGTRLRCGALVNES